jgi:hypothetical protein
MNHFARMLRLHRLETRKSLRKRASEIGIHHATLDRAERTGGKISAENLVKILAWSFRPVSRGRDNHESS